MSEKIGHSIESQSRTADIYVSENADFSEMMLSKNVLEGLTKCNFRKPSPIQLKAIPLGKIGIDLIVQAKSGTGKTVVFSVLALESFTEKPASLNVLILTPTREIAVQIKEVLTAIGSEVPDLKVEYFVGGLPIEEDKEKLKTCHIAVGAPGRIKHLIEKGFLSTKKIKMFILDEADKLMSESFQNDVLAIFKKLPKKKQVIACSATYPKSFENIFELMNSPSYVNPGTDIPTLLGLKQFVTFVPCHSNVVKSNMMKIDEITRIFSSIPFKQCIVFTNYQVRADSVSNFLNQAGWPSTYITGSQTQSERMEAIKKIKKFNYRILISTDLTSRGIDIENINLVINFDVPYNGATYLHRIGRSGRFGSHGICITICDEGTEYENFMHIISSIGNSKVWKLPSKEDMPENLWEYDCDKLETVYVHSDENEQNMLENKEADLSIENLKVAAKIYAEKNSAENSVEETEPKPIENMAYGAPMKQDLESTPQALKLKKNKEDIKKKNISLLEVTKLLLGSNDSEIIEETYSKTNKTIELLNQSQNTENISLDESKHQLLPLNETNVLENESFVDITEETIEKIDYLLKPEVIQSKNSDAQINPENTIVNENYKEKGTEKFSTFNAGDLYTNYGMKAKAKDKSIPRKKERESEKYPTNFYANNDVENLDYFQEGYRRGWQDARSYNPCSHCNPNYMWYQMWREQENQINQYRNYSFDPYMSNYYNYNSNFYH